MGATGNMIMNSNASMRSQQGAVSFKNTLEEIEADILQLAQEVAYCKKEVAIVPSE
jgi:hypothetical protein